METEKEIAEHKKYFFPSCVLVFILGIIPGILIAIFDIHFIVQHSIFWFVLAILNLIIEKKRESVIQSLFGLGGLLGWGGYSLFIFIQS